MENYITDQVPLRRHECRNSLIWKFEKVVCIIPKKNDHIGEVNTLVYLKEGKYLRNAYFREEGKKISGLML